MEKTRIADFSVRVGDDAGLTAFFKDEANASYGREPVLARMKNGTILCFFLSGGATEPHNKNVVICKKSYDDGKTFTDAEVLFSHPYNGLWATELFVTEEKATLVVSMYTGDCPFKMLQTFLSDSFDNGESWSAPRMADPSMATASIRRGITLSNGEILFPIYYTVAPDCFVWEREKAGKPGFWNGTHHECAVAVSSDGGNTFSRFGRLTMDGHSLWENNCVEVSPGHIVMLMRADAPTTGFLGISESFDYGRTWTDARLSSIPNPGSKVTAFMLGDALLLINNFDPADRRRLELRLTHDLGKTWDLTLPMDDPEKIFCYPHAFADSRNRTLYVAYEDYARHYLNRISYDELGL